MSWMPNMFTCCRIVTLHPASIHYTIICKFHSSYPDAFMWLFYHCEVWKRKTDLVFPWIPSGPIELTLKFCTDKLRLSECILVIMQKSCQHRSWLGARKLPSDALPLSPTCKSPQSRHRHQTHALCPKHSYTKTNGEILSRTTCNI